MTHIPRPVYTGGRPGRVSLAQAASWATILSAMIALCAWWFPRAPAADKSPITDSASTSQHIQSASTNTSPATSPGSALRLEVGTCLDASSRPSACDRPHHGEVLPGGTCDTATAVSYLGGVPGTDTLSPTLQTSSTPSGCALHIDDPVERSLKDILSTSAGAPLRYCLDDDRAINCGRPHKSEVVSSEPALSVKSLDCRAAAVHYLGIEATAWENDLTAASVDLGEARGCVVSVRGDNKLTTSLRRLGVSAMPVIAG